MTVRLDVELLEARCVLDTASVGMYGIQATNLVGVQGNLLDGEGVHIGQVENKRAGKLQFDDDDKTHGAINPARLEVFYRDQAITQANDHLEAQSPWHATRVASVMVAGQLPESGVAPQANLLSAAAEESFTLEDTMQQNAITMQHVATRHDNEVWAINCSFGTNVPQGGGLDGNSTMTKFIDWSARTHDTLYVFAGNQAGATKYGKDNYNGFTVAMSGKSAGLYWDLVDQGNNSDSDQAGRHLTTLLAPGVGVKSSNPNAETFDVANGTSFAAPHVTGTIALLQEYAKAKINQVPPDPHWAGVTQIGGTTYRNPQRHEVMKAVLMNSADKINSEGSPFKLMQTRDVYRKDGLIWTNSPGHSETHPLDDQLGVGHLNASRAFTQYQNGQWLAGTDVPSQGWDFNWTSGAGSVARYKLAATVQPGSYISVTLVWDRLVTDANDNGVYTAGEALTNAGFTNMDLFVVPEGMDEGAAVVRSVSTAYNVEHIFEILGIEQKYDILVKQVNAGPTGSQYYGIAWWAFFKPEADPGPLGIQIELAAFASRFDDGSDDGERASLFERAGERLFDVSAGVNQRMHEAPIPLPVSGLPVRDETAWRYLEITNLLSRLEASDSNAWDAWTLDDPLDAENRSGQRWWSRS